MSISTTFDFGDFSLWTLVAAPLRDILDFRIKKIPPIRFLLSSTLDKSLSPVSFQLHSTIDGFDSISPIQMIWTRDYIEVDT